MGVVVVVDPIKMARDRISKLAEKYNLTVLEAESAEKFFSIMKDINYNVDAIVIELQLPDADGFDVLKKVKEKNPSATVMIVTAKTSRNSFINGIRAGASEYIIKPYDDATLELRFSKLFGPINQTMSTDSQQIVSTVAINLDKYLRGEIRKAQKAKISLSIMLMTFYDSSQAYSAKVDADYLRKSQFLFDHLKKIFWDTDVFLPYGSQTFIGIFPFCSKEQTTYITQKIMNTCAEIKNGNRQYDNYDVCITYSSFPEDGETREELLDVITERMISEMKAKQQNQS